MVRSMREWRASRSSIWSRKPIPVEIDDAPVPSRSIATSMSVSLVVRLTEPLRMNGLFASDLSGACSCRRTGPSWPEHALAARLLSGVARLRHCGDRNCASLAPCLHPLQARDPLMQPTSSDLWHGTTILTVRKGGTVVIGGDGQVSIGQTIIKANARKVRRLGKGDVIGGFAGATADAFTLFERLESKLEQYPGQLTRAAVELAKDWRTDRYLRRLEAM